MSAYRIYFTSGDRLRDASGQDTFTAAEAAERVAIHPWAWMGKDGEITVGTYRTRAGQDPGRAVRGTQMAARLRAGVGLRVTEISEEQQP